MKRLRIYVDTSVIGGCFDPEFEQWSQGLFRDFRNKAFTPVTSQVVAKEIAFAPDNVQNKFKELLSYQPEIVEINREIIDLQMAYTKKGILKPKFLNDLLHIAIATYANADVLVSWNFRHIVRFDKILLYNSVNLEMGYRTIQIYSPREVTQNEKE